MPSYYNKNYHNSRSSQSNTAAASSLTPEQQELINFLKGVYVNTTESKITQLAKENNFNAEQISIILDAELSQSSMNEDWVEIGQKKKEETQPTRSTKSQPSQKDESKSNTRSERPQSSAPTRGGRPQRPTTERAPRPPRTDKTNESKSAETTTNTTAAATTTTESTSTSNSSQSYNNSYSSRPYTSKSRSKREEKQAQPEVVVNTPKAGISYASALGVKKPIVVDTPPVQKSTPAPQESKPAQPAPVQESKPAPVEESSPALVQTPAPAPVPQSTKWAQVASSKPKPKAAPAPAPETSTSSQSTEEPAQEQTPVETVTPVQETPAPVQTTSETETSTSSQESSPVASAPVKTDDAVSSKAAKPARQWVKKEQAAPAPAVAEVTPAPVEVVPTPAPVQPVVTPVVAPVAQTSAPTLSSSITETTTITPAAAPATTAPTTDAAVIRPSTTQTTVGSGLSFVQQPQTSFTAQPQRPAIQSVVSELLSSNDRVIVPPHVKQELNRPNATPIRFGNFIQSSTGAPAASSKAVQAPGPVQSTVSAPVSSITGPTGFTPSATISAAAPTASNRFPAVVSQPAVAPAIRPQQAAPTQQYAANQDMNANYPATEQSNEFEQAEEPTTTPAMNMRSQYDANEMNTYAPYGDMNAQQQQQQPQQQQQQQSSYPMGQMQQMPDYGMSHPDGEYDMPYYGQPPMQQQMYGMNQQRGRGQNQKRPNQPQPQQPAQQYDQFKNRPYPNQYPQPQYPQQVGGYQPKQQPNPQAYAAKPTNPNPNYKQNFNKQQPNASTVPHPYNAAPAMPQYYSYPVQAAFPQYYPPHYAYPNGGRFYPSTYFPQNYAHVPYGDDYSHAPQNPSTSAQQDYTKFGVQQPSAPTQAPQQQQSSTQSLGNDTSSLLSYGNNASAAPSSSDNNTPAQSSTAMSGQYEAANQSSWSQQPKKDERSMYAPQQAYMNMNYQSNMSVPPSVMPQSFIPHPQTQSYMPNFQEQSRYGWPQ